MYKNSLILLLLIFCFSCEDDVVPKPKGYLRLEYPEAEYVKSNINVPFTFDINKLASKVSSKQIQSKTKSYALNIEYASLKGTLFLTYKAVKNNKKNLNDFIRDAENLTQKHMIKADEIPVFPFEDDKRRVFGKYYVVKGNVASQSQFHITDSVNHFLTGSLYFYAKPNYDSILPAANYLQKDMKRIMETIEWQ
ncbi:gliding motility lipoprotein GldD [Postechiella marina]|uniref:Gliding motility lipoprotein GldD n=1 Tax=Postechiella marina TaxID=943941 RepID=A0ABP8C7P5_9FLAO